MQIQDLQMRKNILVTYIILAPTGSIKNLTHAYVWYSLAAEGGNSGAIFELLKMESEISSQELQFAQQYRQAWRPGPCKRDLS
jgi:TPR repeat protein